MLPVRDARFFCKEKLASLNEQDKAECAKLPAAAD
jgi:hypothetical protein